MLVFSYKIPSIYHGLSVEYVPENRNIRYIGSKMTAMVCRGLYSVKIKLITSSRFQIGIEMGLVGVYRRFTMGMAITGGLWPLKQSTSCLSFALLLVHLYL